jgi:hypothetical protein
LNVSAFTTVATGGLHHGQAPQKTSMPYGVLQAPSGAPGAQSMGNPGEEVRFQLPRGVERPVTTRRRWSMIDLAKQLLDGERPVLSNHLVLRLWWENTVTYQDPELVNGVAVWNAVSQWCALVDQVS